MSREIEEKEVASGEPLSDYPIEMNPRVMRFIDFFQKGSATRFQTYIARSGRYAPMMRRILREHGLPEDLIYLSMIESGFSPHAYSSAHASGLWQFIQGTGRIYGLKVDKWVDERRDPEKATRAAARHLRDLYERFDDWNLALAAYNCGESRVARAIAKQGTKDFWALDLPRQTEEYVPCFMAAVTLGKDPESYGFRREYDPPLETESVTLHRSYSLSQLSRASGVSLETIKLLNPSLRKDSTPPYRSGFEFHLPAGQTETLVARLEELSREPEPRDEESSVATSSGYHRVKRGETLSKIAAKYGSSVQAIASANNIRTKSVIHSGQRLKIPGMAHADEGRVAASSSKSSSSQKSKSSSTSKPSQKSDSGVSTASTYTVRRGDTVAKIAAKHGVSVSSILKSNKLNARSHIYPGQSIRVQKGSNLAAEAKPPKKSGKQSTGGSSASIVTYTVRAGDTLWKIAKRFGTSVTDILSINELRNDSVIRPGDRLKIAQ
ncbi:MAG: LysM peptidoglycan-binding domain-containing protein [bacterium]